MPFWRNLVNNKCESPEWDQLMDARIEHYIFSYFFFASIDTLYLGFDKIYVAA